MKELLQNLLKLQTLEFDVTVEPEMEKQIDDLRARIPAPVLGHYDRLLMQGKRALAPVRNQVCGGCHIHVPRAFVLTLMHETDIQICQSCGRYLYLPEPTEPETPPACPAGKNSAKPRGRKELLHAA